MLRTNRKLLVTCVLSRDQRLTAANRAALGWCGWAWPAGREERGGGRGE